MTNQDNAVRSEAEVRAQIIEELGRLIAEGRIRASSAARVYVVCSMVMRARRGGDQR